MTVPARRPVDDALDRLGNGLRATAESLGTAVSTQWFDDLATVRSELERLREERDELRREVDLQIGSMSRWADRAKAAEAELARTREGLREAVETIHFPCAECKPFIDKARALLAVSPRPPGDTEGEFRITPGQAKTLDKAAGGGAK